MALKLTRIEPTSPEDWERFEQDQADFDWLAEHSVEIEEQHKGRYIAVVNRELFVGDNFDEARRKALEKYPDRDPYVEYVPIKRRVIVL